MLPVPRTESSRLDLLRQLDILDTASEPAFDALVQTASAACRCPISLMSLVDVDRQWFKAAVGLNVSETPRDQAFCAHAIHGEALFEISDALGDERFAHNPLVTSEPRIRHYAGQPIVFEGVPLGTLCVVDRVPRTLDDDQKQTLRRLSVVMAELLHGRMEAIAHRREADRLNDFANLSGDWLWESDVAHRCTWLSGAATCATGLLDGDVVGQRFRDLDVLDGFGRPAGGGIVGLLERGVAFSNVVVAAPTAEGRRYLSLAARPMLDGRGRPNGFRGSVRDVTDALRVEIDLRERENLLRKIAGQVPGFIYQYRSAADGSVCYQYASEGIRDVYEVSPDDVRSDGSMVFSRIHPDDLAAIQDSIRASQAAGTIWHMRYRVVLPRKGLRWLQGSSVPERLADGSTVWHGYITDVTDSHARDRELESANAALLHSERRLLALTDNLPALVSYIDRDRRYRFVNAYHDHVFGADSQAMLGRTVDEMREIDREHVAPYVDRVLTGELTSFEGESTVRGSTCYYQSTFVPDHDADGTVVGFYAMTLDLTQRKRAELRQAASERLLRGVTDHLPALVCHVGLDDRYRFANAAYRDWLGYDHLAMVGQPIDAYLDDATCRAMRPYIDRARGGERLSFERCATIGGRDRHLLVEYVPDRDDDGRVVGIYAMTTDVTERRCAELLLLDSEKRLLDITNNIPAVIGQFDMEERCLFANRIGLEAHGIARDEVHRLTFGSHIDPELYEQHRPAIREVLAGRRSTVHGMRCVDGEPTWFKAHLTPDLDDRGRQRGFYVVTFDVTTLKVAELRSARSEERLRELTDALPVLIAYIDGDRRVSYCNETFRMWIGQPRDALIGRDVMSAVGLELYAERRGYLDRCFAGQRVDFEIHSIVDGVARHLQTTYLPDFGPHGTVVGITTLSVDVTDRIVAERRLSQLAHSDALTGLPNRLRFNDELDSALQRCRGGCTSLAVMFLDVDRFKAINDTHGHAVGDQVLKEFGTRIRHAVRPTDFVARLAGDEFVVILEGLHDAQESERIAGKIVDSVRRPFEVSAGALSISTSIGIAFRDVDVRSSAELLAKADAALYRAKEAGRDTFRLAA